MNERHLAALDFLVRAELKRSFKELIKSEEASGYFGYGNMYYGEDRVRIAEMNSELSEFESARNFLGEQEFLAELITALTELGL